MKNNNVKIILISIGFCIHFMGCTSFKLRLPSSSSEVYSNQDVRQGLLLAASQNILFSISDEALMDVEKTEIDSQCRKFEAPFWSSKLSVYLNLLRSHPDWFSKFHVIEIRKGDEALVKMDQELDGASVLSIQYVLTEVRGQVSFKTQMPCNSTIASYFGKEIVKTNFEFPTSAQFEKAVTEAKEKKSIKRFQFKNDFLTYLAERGVIYKFEFDDSFEKNSEGQFLLAQALDQLANEVQSTHQGSFGYIDLWLKKINENSKQAELIQLFGIEPSKKLISGLKVDTKGTVTRDKLGQPDLTYLFITYSEQSGALKSQTLSELNLCLKEKIDLLFNRKIAQDEERSSYLAPGFLCEL